MAFFLIVPSVIVVTIFLVHSIAHRIGFKVKYFSLVLCAFMSLAINFAAIELSTYLDKWHYVRLGALIFTAALIVTLINRYLIRHEKSDVTIITDMSEIEEELAIEETNEKPATVAVAKTAKIVEDTEAIEKIVPVKSKVESKISKLEEKTPKSEEKIQEPKTVDKPKEDKPQKVALEKPTETKKPEKTEELKPADEAIKPKVPAKATDKAVEVKKAEGKKPEVETKNQPKIAPTKAATNDDDNKIEKPDKPSKVEKTKLDDKSKINDKPKLDDKSKPAEKPKQDEKTQEPKTEIKKNVEDKMADVNAHLGSLDDILDYAYAQKSKGDLNQAIIAYQKALDRYRNDDYAPFIAIDLGNIYKEQAAYTKFIKTYEEALKLPVVMRNADTRREFTKNLSYMRIVLSVLVRHRALTIPFSKIPRQYLQEVETEFKALQLNTSTTRRHL